MSASSATRVSSYLEGYFFACSPPKQKLEQKIPHKALQHFHIAQISIFIACFSLWLYSRNGLREVLSHDASQKFRKTLNFSYIVKRKIMLNHWIFKRLRLSHPPNDDIIPRL